MAMIDDFKASLLGGGARANQFRVTITEPVGIGIGLDLSRTSFLVRSAALPASTLGEIAVPFRGRSIYLAGDRADPDTWDTTFLNDTDFMVRNAMERWHNGINDYIENTGVNFPADYTAELTVQQRDRDDTILKTYTFHHCWPTSISAIELASDANDAIEEFTVTWRFQHFSTSDVGQGQGAAARLSIRV